MEGNKFEKQVQMEMDELKLQPSDAVWKKIESQIRKKKDRRWILFMLLFAVIAVGAGYMYSFQTHKNLSIISSRSNNKIDAKKSDSNYLANNIVKKQKVENHDSSNKNLVSVNVYRNQTPFINPGTSVLPKAVKKISTQAYDKRKQHFNSNSKVFATAINPVEAQDNTPIRNNEVNNGVLTDSSKTKIVIADIKTDSSINKKLTENKKVSENKKVLPKSNWQIGIVAAAGNSGTGTGITSFRNTYMNPYAYSNGVSAPAPALPSLSISKPSAALSLGVNFQRHISKEFDFKIGLNYIMFTTTINVGARFDSSNGYSSISYQNAPNIINIYKNKYNFLEMPVGVTFNFLKSHSIPLSLEAAVNISELIKTNSLQFYQFTGIYSINNSFFNKTQLGISAGLSALLFKKNRHPVSLGPFLSYDISSMAKDGVYVNQHYIFAALRAAILLKK